MTRRLGAIAIQSHFTSSEHPYPDLSEPEGQTSRFKERNQFRCTSMRSLKASRSHWLKLCITDISSELAMFGTLNIHK